MKIILLLIPFINGLHNSPSCVKCKFYKPNKNDDYDTTFYSKCNYLGREKYVDTMRESSHLCGAEGKYFEETNNLMFKKIKHNILKNYFNIIIISFTFNYIFYIFFNAFRHY